MRIRHQGAGLFQSGALGIQTLRVALGARYRADEQNTGMRGARFLYSLRRFSRRIFMRTQPQHHVEEHHRRFGVFRFLEYTGASRLRLDHGMGFSPREEVIAHVHDRMAL